MSSIQSKNQESTTVHRPFPHQPLNDPNIPAAIAENVLSPMGILSARSVPPGMSGATLYRCEQSSGQLWALKRWPDGTRRSRIEEVHRIIQGSRSNGCDFVPMPHAFRSPANGEPASIYSHAGGHWELMQWLPGAAADANATLEKIKNGASAIAKFHRSVRCFGTRQQRPPAVVSRLNRLRELDPLLKQTLDSERLKATDLSPVVFEACQLLQWKWDEVRARMTRSLSQYLPQHVQTQYVLRDVHREHILFCDERVTGLIDFDATRVDIPETDLARWVGSFLFGQTDTKSAWEAALAGFHAENTSISGPKWEIDPKMAKDICFATSWISLANWLVWILHEPRSFPAGPQAVVSRLQELIEVVSRDT